MLVGLVALLAVVTQPAVARAEFGFVPGSEELSAVDAEGQPENRAGAHPDRLLVKFDLNTLEEEKADGNVKDIVVDLPPGLTGDPNGVPACPRKVFDGGLAGEECPSETQVGEARLRIPVFEQIVLPIYNVEALPDQAAALGAGIGAVRLPIAMKLRSRDYGTTLTLANVFQPLPVTGVEIELWGVPVDHQGEPAASRHPFLTLPGRCDGPPELTLRVNSWQAPDVEHTAHVDTGPDLTGCESQAFEPSIAFAMESPAADAPSGSRVEIATPDAGGPDDLANAQIRDAVVALPEGVTLSPAGIAGIEACPDAAFGLGEPAAAACPVASRVGSVEMASSVLAAPIAGKLYLGEERPGERFRLLVDASGPGVEVKFAGRLEVDPATGRLTVSLTEMPQIPVERLTLSFADGPRAPLVTPLDCGSLTVAARFDSHGGATREVTSPAQDRGDPACHAATAFEPGFVAGGSETRAGGETALAIAVSREDGEQALDRFLTRLPRGVSPALGAVERCGAPGVASGDCPPASRVGSAVAEVGSGSEPVTLRGDVFLTGPYRRAPIGLVLTFRALLGSFDIGRLAVRGALKIDPRSGRATLETASLPQILEGLPIRFRTVGIDIDRPGFIHNPTSCAAQSFEATIVSAGGSRSDATSPFQVRRCGSLRFRPAVSMALRGARSLHRRGKPQLRIALRAPRGSTNLRNARIPLPRGLELDPTAAEEICARPEAVAGECPPGARVGVAVASTALLRGRMRGSIFAAQPAGNGLPDLWIDLRENGLHLLVHSRTLVRKGRLVTRLAGMPDVPVSALRMRFRGGGDGLFRLRRSLCGRRDRRSMRSRVAFEGHDGAFRIARVRLRHSRCATARARRSRHG